MDEDIILIGWRDWVELSWLDSDNMQIQCVLLSHDHTTIKNCCETINSSLVYQFFFPSFILFFYPQNVHFSLTFLFISTFILFTFFLQLLFDRAGRAHFYIWVVVGSYFSTFITFHYKLNYIFFLFCPFYMIIGDFAILTYFTSCS